VIRNPRQKNLDENSRSTEIDSRSTRFVDLLTSHQRDLFAYIDMLMAGDTAVPDVLQDTNLALWSRLADFDFDRPFLPWAFGFAYQRVLAWRKTRSRSRLVFSDEILELISEVYLQDTTTADVRLAALRTCLEKLDADDARLVQERYVDRAAVKSLASRFGQTANQISVRLFRIRHALGRCVEAALVREGSP
jgi:RNA polymerase sigma-70 factor, ECF subfamily